MTKLEKRKVLENKGVDFKKLSLGLGLSLKSTIELVTGDDYTFNKLLKTVK